MCGIAGIARFDGPTTPADVEGVLRMLDAQIHRGPNDWGILVPDYALRIPEVRGLLERRGLDHVRTYPAGGSVPGAVLGSRRLSIIDLSPRGRMPMGTAGGRTWITYNGEVYNARELRAELTRLGYAFDSDSDTEAILHGYEAWGDDVVHHLRGMFAFAVLDLRAGPRLLLARDRFGIKPVYYRNAAETVVFASEVGALRRSGLVRDEPDPDALAAFLRLGSVPAPKTTLKGVRSLPSGCRFIDCGAGATVERYWDLEAAAATRAREETFEALATRTRVYLEDSVRSHLVSDVPTGVFLSGGTDSSSLVAMASRLGPEPVTTVSLVFEETAFSEARYARLVADRYRTVHHEICVREQDFLDDAPHVLAAMDQPSVDGVNAYFVSRAARTAGLTVVLSGIGGDEVFLGYSHFARLAALSGARRALADLPESVRRALVRGTSAVAVAAGLRGAAKIGYLERPTVPGLYLAVRGLFTAAQVETLLGRRTSADPLEEAAFVVAGEPYTNGSADADGFLRRFVRMEFERYLQNQILRDTDIMSMAHSLETRVPFLDHPLVEEVFAAPMRHKLRKGVTKGLLVTAMAGNLPTEVWDRPKMGFTFPFRDWLDRHADDFRSMTLASGLVDPEAVTRLWAEFRAGRAHWSRPWALVVLAHALRQAPATGLRAMDAPSLRVSAAPPRHAPPTRPSASTRLKARLAHATYAAADLALEALRRAFWPGPQLTHAGRVCIYRVGNVGDIVCALPAMQAIRKAYPAAHLTLVTSPGSSVFPGARELLAGAEWLDDLVVYESGAVSTTRARLSLIASLRRRRFDVWIELPNALAPFKTVVRNMLLARLTGARWGWGWRQRTVRWWAQAQSETQQFPNEVEALLAVVRRGGVATGDLTFGLPVGQAETEVARRLLAEAGLAGRPLVAVSPGAKRSTNRWPLERYAEVCRCLADRGFGVVVVGGAEDAEACAAVVRGAERQALNAAGRTSLLESAAILRECLLLICNDSGVQHLAAAMGVPCVSLFSAREFRGKWYPHGNRSVVLEKWVECHTCLLEACPYDNRCIKLIPTDEVCRAIERVIDVPPSPWTASAALGTRLPRVASGTP